MNSSPELLRHLHKNPNHSILVKTMGTKSNRDGIGAEVKVIAGNLTQYDTVRSGGSYLSSSDLRLHFGLGPERPSTASKCAGPADKLTRSRILPSITFW